MELPGTGRGDAAFAGHAPRHGRRAGGSRAGRILALTVTAVLASGVSGAAAITFRLHNNVTRVDVSGLLGVGAHRPPVATADPKDPHAGAAVNILLIGSDDRSGANAAVGGKVGGMRSDTTMVLHVSADRSRVEIVSIPRDSMVPIPACQVTGGKATAPSRLDMFNSAFANGWDAGGDLVSAAACTMTTVESLTGVGLNGFISVDFAGFTAMIDAIGGVPMCIPTALHDQDAELDLTAGSHVLDGSAALALARARYDLSDGSDTYRMGRQQALLAATARSVLDKNVLKDAPQLLRFLDAATRSVTMSQDVSLEGVAFSLRNINPADVRFLTIPSGPMPSNSARVVWSPAAAPIWKNMVGDQPLGSDASAPASVGTVLASPVPIDPLADRKPGQVISAASSSTTCS